VPAIAPPSSPVAAAPRRRRPSRAKPKPPRPREVLLSELRGLGALVLEQALQDSGARPRASLAAWAAQLASELGCAAAPAPPSYGALMRRVVEINREAEAHPGRPTRRMPLAA
jgi:hypothetical protein